MSKRKPQADTQNDRHDSAARAWGEKLIPHERAHAKRLADHAALPPADVSEHEARLASAKAALDAHAEEGLAGAKLSGKERTAHLAQLRARHEPLAAEHHAAQKALHEARRRADPPPPTPEHTRALDASRTALAHLRAAESESDAATKRDHLCQAAALAGLHGVDATDIAAAVAAIDRAP